MNGICILGPRREGVLVIDHFERGKTITGVYFAQLVRKLHEIMKEKRRVKLCQGIVFHEDDAPVHTCAVAGAAIRECGFGLLPHPPYSPDLAQSDLDLHGLTLICFDL